LTEGPPPHLSHRQTLGGVRNVPYLLSMRNRDQLVKQLLILLLDGIASLYVSFIYLLLTELSELIGLEPNVMHGVNELLVHDDGSPGRRYLLLLVGS